MVLEDFNFLSPNFPDHKYFIVSHESKGLFNKLTLQISLVQPLVSSKLNYLPPIPLAQAVCPIS